MPYNNQTIIAIVGASASGKSLFATTIYEELLPEIGAENITIIKEDSYYRCQNHLEPEIRPLTNYDHPDAFEHELLVTHLDQLAEGKSIEVPEYSYIKHTRKETTQTLKPSKVILVEGILLLSDAELRKRFGIKVFMDTPLDICLIRRIKRDLIERGRSLDSITEQYKKTVRPMYFQHIEPSKVYADIFITQGGKNRMAIEILKAKVRQLTA